MVPIKELTKSIFLMVVLINQTDNLFAFGIEDGAATSSAVRGAAPPRPQAKLANPAPVQTESVSSDFQ